MSLACALKLGLEFHLHQGNIDEDYDVSRFYLLTEIKIPKSKFDNIFTKSGESNKLLSIFSNLK